MPVLAEGYDLAEADISWDESRVRSRLFKKCRAMSNPLAFVSGITFLGRSMAITAAVACFLVVCGFAAYRVINHSRAPVPGLPADSSATIQTLAIQESSLEAQLRNDAAAMSELQKESARKDAEIGNLRAALQDADSRFNAASASNERQVSTLINERDGLAQRLDMTQKEYQAGQEELAKLRSDSQLQTASLQSKVQRLSGQMREQEQSLQEKEQYLDSDRDIRELMGARQLYIADVFDVDKTGRGGKPFGRVFYTKNKSLVVYAFDLDSAPGLKNVSTFQAWGCKDLACEGTGRAKPLSLGILYMDNEANRRWALRYDDPANLAQLAAIFITAEPAGGSPKPTGKRYLYASLVRVANHP
jgi:anti-sigma-K factor RskA